jgi:cation-transporting ATPase E
MLAVLVVSLGLLLIVARPLAGWKLALVTSLAGIAAAIVAAPVFAHGIFLLHLSAERVAIAAAFAGLGLLLVTLWGYRSAGPWPDRPGAESDQVP